MSITKAERRLPLVSVIVPNYNHAPFLEKRLRSISQQTHQNIEIILLDDASTDDSQAILSQFARTNKKVVSLNINESNSGLPIRQWNKGVSQAKGEYIWIAESDDEAEPDFISSLIALSNRFPSARVVYCDSVIIDEDSQTVAPYDYSSNQYEDDGLWKRDFCENGRNFLAKFMLFRNLIPNVSAVLFKASALKSDLKQSSYKFCADWELYSRILASSDVAYCSKPMNKFRKHIQTTRWHNTKSYALELKEKVTLLKSLKQAWPNDSLVQENVKASLQYIYKNRHKHRRVARLCEVIADIDRSSLDQLCAFGANDIAELVVETARKLNISCVVIDNHKANQRCRGLNVSALCDCTLSDKSVVVLCSLAYQASMLAQLERHSFHGQIIRV